MKIYQVHEYGGCYEDSFDHIIGTYFNRDNAVEQVNKAYVGKTELQEIVDKCNKCTQFSDTKNDCFECGGGGYCSNVKLYLTGYEDAEYEIKEVQMLDVDDIFKLCSMPDIFKLSEEMIDSMPPEELIEREKRLGIYDRDYKNDLNMKNSYNIYGSNPDYRCIGCVSSEGTLNTMCYCCVNHSQYQSKENLTVSNHTETKGV